MATVGTAEVEVEISKAKVRREADAAGREIEQSLGQSADKARKELEDKLGQIRIGAGIGVAAGVGIGLAKATSAASDLNETTSKSAAVFGEAQSAVLAYAESADQGIGLSKKAALDATSTFGNLFTQLGVGQQEAAGLSTKMVTLAADFGSFFNEDPTAIIEAQTAAFRGEYDALQKYVPTINAAAVEQQALTETGKANADQLTQQEKALATYSLMMEGAGAAQGDFARTSDSAANAQKRAAAEVENNSASIGQALLPAYTAGLEIVGSFARAFGELPAPIQTGVVGIGGMTLATALLLPKLIEGGQLLKLAGSKAVSYAQDLIVPTKATEGLGQATDATSGRLGKITGALAVAGAGITAYNLTYGLLEEKYASDVDAGSLAKDLLLLGEGASDGQRVFDQYGGSVDDLAGKINVLADALDNTRWENLSKGSNTAFGNVNNIKNEIADLDKVLADLAESNPDAAAQAYSALVVQLTDQGVAVEDIVRVFPNYLDQVDRSKEANGGAAGATEGHAGAQEDLADKADKAAEALRGQVDAARDVFDAQRGVTSAEEDYVNATIEVDQARKGVADAERDVADAQRGVAEAYRAVRDAQEGVADALRAVEDARKGVADAERAVVDAQEAAAEAADEVTTATEDLAQARRDAAGEAQEIKDAYQGVIDAEADLVRTQEDALIAQQDLDAARAGYADTLKGLSRDAAAAADDVTSAEIRLREAQQRLADLGKPDKDGNVKPVSADERTAAEIAIREAERRVEIAREREAAAKAEYERQRDAGVEGSDAVVEAQGRLEVATDAVTAANDRRTGAVQAVADAQTAADQRVQDAQDRLTTAIGNRADADQRVVDAKDGVVEAQDRVRDAAAGVLDAQQRVRDATNGVADANQRVVDAKDGVATAQAAVAKANDGVTAALLLLAAAQYEVGLKTGDTKTAIGDQIARLEDLRNKIDPSNPLRQQLDEYIARLQATNGNFTATIALNFTDAAGAVITDAQAVIDAAIPRRAKGGPVKPGTPYLVGEERPEVFWPDQAGTIIPSAEGFGAGTAKAYTFAPTYNGILDAEEASALANAEWSWRMSLEPA